MRPTRPAVLVAVLVVVALVTWLIVSRSYSGLWLVPWTAIPTVLLLAVGEAYTGWMTRARIARRPDTKPVEPLAVARLAALGKASAYGGALFAGLFGGFVLHTATQLEKETPRSEFFVTGGSMLACVVLVCAALFLEHSCRIPGDPEGPRPE
ncbi:DUF3180 domain-containing protein [Nonomuraea sp. NPDC048826]|uniref:DUF3180 domain-containing protein n=1 Tax=Nonomuraea sp. NPDC048826 TaxID=3364347 RepID=UPI0037240384